MTKVSFNCFLFPSLQSIMSPIALATCPSLPLLQFAVTSLLGANKTQTTFPPSPKLKTYLSADDGHLNLTTGSGHDGAELFADAGEEAQSVVGGEGVEEVLDRLAAGAGLLDELLNNGRLVLLAQSRGAEDGSELDILLEDGGELGEGLGRCVEAGSLDRRRVLQNSH